MQLDPTRRGREAESLAAHLRKCIVGQEEAVEQIVNIYQKHRTAISALDRPIGNLLFLAPTGSGKTRIVEATAEALVGNSGAVIKIDCAEFQHSHEIAKPIGSPPGYLGHRETHPLLTQEVLNQYHTEKCKVSFVLFDEIEKASDALWNLLLGILDKETLTLGDNRGVDFSRALIFMTSNVGAMEMNNVMAPKLGFRATDGQLQNISSGGRLKARIASAGVESALRKFTPEFINRLDKITVFKPPGDTELRKILDIELRMVQQPVLAVGGNRFIFACSSAARGQALSNLTATHQIFAGDSVLVDYDVQTERLVFAKDGEDIPPNVMAEAVLPFSAMAQSNGAGGNQKWNTLGRTAQSVLAATFKDHHPQSARMQAATGIPPDEGAYERTENERYNTPSSGSSQRSQL